MDDQFEIDEELLNFVNLDESIPISQESNNPIEQSIFFNCTGEDTKHATISKTGFIGQSDIAQLSKHHRLPEHVDIFARELDLNVFTNTQLIQMLYQKARMNIQMIEGGVSAASSFSKDTSFFALRQDVTELLYYSRICLQNFELPLQTLLSNFRMTLSSLDSLQNFTSLSTGHSPQGNKCVLASYHLLHGNLEWRWLLLTIQLKVCQGEKSEFNKSLRGSAFEMELEEIIYDLTCISMCKYNKKTQADLVYGSPFPCVCVKETWLLVVQLVGKLNEMNEISSFWTYFNKIVDDIREDRSTYARFSETNASIKIMLRKSVPISSKTPIHFSIWLLCGIASLFGLNHKGELITQHELSMFGINPLTENQDFLEDLLQVYLKTDPSEEKLRSLLFTMSPVILELWTPRSNIVMILWEHFSKRLNSNFYVTGTALASLATVSDSAQGCIDQVEQILSSTSNPNNSSFSMFVRVLAKTVLRFQELSQNQQVLKLLGRVYSKFSASKMMALNESGLHNMNTLFLAMSLAGDMQDFGPKFMELLLQMPLKSLPPTRQAAIIKAHVALLLLHHRKNCDMTLYIEKFLQQLKGVYEKYEPGQSGASACLKILADGVIEILGGQNLFLEHGEHLLIDSWVRKFLVHNSMAEQDRLLATVNLMLVNLRKNQTTSNSINPNELVLKQSLYTFVLPHVKKSFVQSSVSLVVPEVAANFTLCCNEQTRFTALFRFFIEGNVINTSKYLVCILSVDNRPHVDETVIIQNWIKCMLMQESNVAMDSTRLLSAVANLEEFKEMYTGDLQVFLNSKEPLRAFFMEVGKRYLEGDYKRKCEITEKISQYLTSFEKWAIEGLKVQTTSFKIFNMIAVTFLFCSKIIYSRSKMSCFFNVVMSQFILPTPLLIGKPQPQHLTLAIMRIWHILIEGISHLDYKSDAYVTKTLSDLITKWTPHFNVGNNAKVAARPYLCLMKNENRDILSFVLDKFSTTFLAAQRQPHDNACLALTISSEIFNVIVNDETKLELFLNAVSFHLIQHSMLADDLVPSKNICFNLLLTILSCPALQSSQHVREIVVKNLEIATGKYLSMYDKFYFSFMQKLSKANVALVYDVLDYLKAQILDTEQRRGLAHDSRLRSQYDQLKSAVLASRANRLST